MSTLERGVRVTLALMVFAGLAAIAQAKEPRGGHEPRPEGERQAARREAEPRETRRIPNARPQSAHISAPRRPSPVAEHAAVTHRRQVAARSIREQHPADAGIVHENHAVGFGHPVGVGRVYPGSRTFTNGQVHIVRYGNALSGTVERSVRPGFVSRTFVSGGQVLYTHVYQSHVWHQYGRSFAYETFVPAVRFPGIYYAWALGAWPRPVFYTWGWQGQPWYPTYGFLFAPYPVYASPDQWMTDYIIAQNMQTAYQAQAAVPPPQPYSQEFPAAPAPDTSVAPPASEPGYTTLTPRSNDSPPAAQPGDTSAPVAPPPAITPEIKAQLNEQIKVQLREQQAAQAMPATLTTQSTPAALRSSHVFFEVVQPLDVTTANGHCSLKPNDYIKRTGAMSSDDWMIPVQVELSGPSDCPEGLTTRIGLNDLNAMENEQEAQVMEAMRAASKGMGPNGPPSGAQPTLIADGSAAAAPGALDAIRQAQ